MLDRDCEEIRGHALSIALSAAVPLWIWELQSKGGPSDKDLELAKEFSQVLAEKGDILQFDSKGCAKDDLFNRLAHAVAVLAFKPGGVECFGSRWEAKADEDSSHL